MTNFEIRLDHKQWDKSCMAQEICTISLQICKTVLNYIGTLIVAREPSTEPMLEEMVTLFEWYLGVLGRAVARENQSPRHMEAYETMFYSLTYSGHISTPISFTFNDIGKQKINLYVLINLVSTVMEECFQCVCIETKTVYEKMYLTTCSEKVTAIFRRMKELIDRHCDEIKQTSTTKSITLYVTVGDSLTPYVHDLLPT